MRQLPGKRALITGAASGIGRALALELARASTNLYLLDNDADGLKRTAQEAGAIGVGVDARVCDVSQPAAIESAVDEAIDRWAGVDILVNNAGVTYYGFTHCMPAEEWRRIVAINLQAPMQLTWELLPSLLARPEAHVLNVCSVLGLMGAPRVWAYCGTKFGLVGLSQSLRAEYGRWGLGVTALCPGFAKTELFTNANTGAEDAEHKVPPRFMCVSPERIARAGVRAIRRDQAEVRMEPFSRAMLAAKRLIPTPIDWALRLGRRRRLKGRRANLAAISPDRTEALRQVLAEQEQLPAMRRSA